MSASTKLAVLVRRLSGIARLPVEIIDGDSAPATAGESWHYETRGGRRIWHPSAYSKRGWSNMVYVGCCRRIEVGRGWLLAKAAEDSRLADELTRLALS